MKLSDRIIAAIQSFRGPVTNSMGADLARDFLKRGNTKPLIQDWSKVIMTDKDLYTGYPYAAINNRANKVAQLALNNLKTDASDPLIEAARKKEVEIHHPYLDTINNSKTFSNYKFWYDISTYLDLEGVYYLMVVRTVGEGEDSGRIGNPIEFQLLNPYNIRRILDKETLKVGGYVETRDGMVRTFPPEMIIEIRKLNPFDDDNPFAMTDAAKESQFTLKQAGDYTRHSLKNNMSAPGIISTDVILEPEQFKNFASRIMNQEKGVPLFGNGSGAITWDSMQIDMDKAALDKINEINRQSLFAVSGVGKTMMSIEESGTTRDTARVQKELFIENHVMPQLQLVIDALNQDYKTNYEKEYATNLYEICIDNPLETDREAELKDVEIREKSYKLYDKLVGQGYKAELASKYTEGKITLEELGEPTEEPRLNPLLPIDDTTDDEDEETDTEESLHGHTKNEFDEDEQGILSSQQASLQSTIQGIDGRLTNAVLNYVFKVDNKFESVDEVLSEKEQESYVDELAVSLGLFYSVIIPLYAKSNLSARLKEFGMVGTFKMNSDVKRYIKEVSDKAAASHIGTVLSDLQLTIKKAYDEEVQRILDGLGRDVNDEDLKFARKRALEGASRVRITSEVTNKYSGSIEKERAKVIARTEMNRAFTQSQYQSDLQFIKQNSLEGKAFKKWTTRSDNPCAICQSLAAQGPIPFKTNFANLGDELTATYTDEKGATRVLKQTINFEELSAGNAHVNCSCKYILIII